MSEENLVVYKAGEIPMPPSANRAEFMTDDEIMAAAHSDPDTVIIDNGFLRTNLMFFSPDGGQHRYAMVPPNSLLEVDAENRILGVMPRIPVAPPPIGR